MPATTEEPSPLPIRVCTDCATELNTRVRAAAARAQQPLHTLCSDQVDRTGSGSNRDEQREHLTTMSS
ncbi:unnamed protein product [Nippostrongylus brasiliensis]|uniref:Uncharacterized protein n=1 Tax=Nippostrongylus brasiliensis TaxID=27835 RepID=A0A0N4YYP4_NIPBR|nr:unnamed protein product [Nippostrongylus brasiliensis]